MRFTLTLACVLLFPVTASASAGRLWVGSFDSGCWETCSYCLSPNADVDPIQVEEFLQAAETLVNDGLAIQFVFYQTRNLGNSVGPGPLQGQNPVANIPNVSALVAHLRHGTLIQMDIVDSDTGNSALSVVIDDLAGETNGSLAMFDVVSAVTSLSADLIVKDGCPELVEMGDATSESTTFGCEPIDSFGEDLDRSVQLTVEVVDGGHFSGEGPAAVIYLDLF